MITEQEARWAWVRLLYYCDIIGGPSRSRGYDSSADQVTLLEWAVDDLTRRQRERSERAKPIDAEWCLANGARRGNQSGEVMWEFNAVNVYWQESWGVTIEGDPYERIFLHGITIRGQLLDLLSALKGGAT